jgi:hypothetical protein
MLLLSTVPPVGAEWINPTKRATRFASGTRRRFALLAATCAFAAFLDWRTRHRSVGAEHAAIACERLQLLAASLADVEELAGVRWHLLNGSMAALRAGEGGLELHRRLARTISTKRRFIISCPVTLRLPDLDRVRKTSVRHPKE